MKMLFRQRFFSWLDSYDVHAEDGTVLFTVKGVLSWRYTLKIFTPDGREAGMIKARMITFPKPVFDLTVNGGAAGCITQEFSLFRPSFTLDFRNWKISGDWLEWNYRIMRGSTPVAVIAKRLWNLTDTYEIDVTDPEDALGALMVTLAIDAVKSSK
ncbi:LURP-one-related/scramblase family protein [Victivallis vadensis]|uniref:LURP-one-related/scramblase family protein n=1 Tax=Victivallis vadensis TaxID=172901 RepID=UPI00266B9C97|nr:hypothetical protein [Victivallis vadensis]